MYICFKGGKRKALTLSYDDGVVQDIRLTEILKKHGIKCTFNISSGLFLDDYQKTRFTSFCSSGSSALFLFS